MNVYLSSTLSDLEAERDAVRDALANHCRVKESYSADPRSVTESCVDDVVCCDIYVGIVGLRYGTRPNNGEPSITTLEYDAAFANSIPRLMFLKNEAAIKPEHIEAEKENLDRVNAFRLRVSTADNGGVRSDRFSTVEELRGKVLDAYINHIERKGRALPPALDWVAWVKRAHDGLISAFKRPVFAKFEKVLPLHAEGLPIALAGVFEDPDPHTVGERCVDGVIELARLCLGAIEDGSAVLAGNDHKVFRKDFLSAMRCAAHLCLDPARLQACGIDPHGKLPSIVDVPAHYLAGATLATRARPDESWVLGKAQGIAIVEDCHTQAVKFEMGEGEDRKKALSIAAFHAVAGPVAQPEIIDDALRRTIRGRAVRHAKDGRARYVVLSDKLSPAERSELEIWVADFLGVNLLLLRAPKSRDEGLFLYDEELLLGAICAFLELFPAAA